VDTMPLIVKCEPSLSSEDTALVVDVLEDLSVTFHRELQALYVKLSRTNM